MGARLALGQPPVAANIFMAARPALEQQCGRTLNVTVSAISFVIACCVSQSTLSAVLSYWLRDADAPLSMNRLAMEAVSQKHLQAMHSQKCA